MLYVYLEASLGPHEALFLKGGVRTLLRKAEHGRAHVLILS